MPIDLRTQKLAKLVVNYSVFVKPNENVIISGGTEAEEFIKALYKEVILAGAHPILKVSPKGLAQFFYKYAKKHQLEKYPEILEHSIKNSHKYIGIDTSGNTKELANINPIKITTRQKITKKISDLICNNKPNMHRCSVGFPCSPLAQDAEMSDNEYEKFVFDSCLQDWKKLGKQMNKIKSKFKKNSKVYLIGKGVDLKFNVHGEKAVADKGEENMPGGEVFMAPIRESLNGYIEFEYPSTIAGKEIIGIKLKFENGKVTESSSRKNEDFLKQMILTDENASYVGEFGIGCNPKINKYTNNLLFDEKIGGTIHLALGKAYVENGGGNDSAIHWDIVKSMKQAKIIVDGKVIQENGKWKI